MSDILTTDEVDALLKGVEEGTIPAGAGTASALAGVQALDLTRQARSLRGRLPGLELVLDRLVRQLRGSLGTYFNQVPGVNVVTVDVVSYASLLDRLPAPRSLHLFRLAPLRGQGLLIVTPPLVSALLQIFFGGDPGRATPLPSREFSAIELHVLERLGRRILADLRDAWQPVAPLECTPVSIETNPTFAAIAAGQDLVVSVELAVEVEGVEEARILIVMPNAAFDSIRPRLQRARDDGEQKGEGAWSDLLRTTLGTAEVEVSAELGTHRMPLRAVLNLRAGDVIPLGTGREGPVVVRVAGRPRFVGAPGVSSGNNAVRVTGRS